MSRLFRAWTRMEGRVQVPVLLAPENFLAIEKEDRPFAILLNAELHCALIAVSNSLGPARPVRLVLSGHTAPGTGTRAANRKWEQSKGSRLPGLHITYSAALILYSPQTRATNGKQSCIPAA